MKTTKPWGEPLRRRAGLKRAVVTTFQSVTGALENTTRLRLAKREIARILTVRHERELKLKR